MKSLLWFCLLLFLHSTNAQEACSTEGNVRLQGLSDASNPDPLAGRVEYCQNGVWGTVCGDSDSTPWSEKNGHVVCRDLGFSGALNSILQDTLPAEARAPEGTPINIHNVACLGHEGALDNCPSLSDTSACTHDQDVAITCRPGLEFGEEGDIGDIRLIGDVRNGYGAVQLRDMTTGFIGICPDDGTFDTVEANIVCRQLGYDSGSVMEYSDDFGSFFPATKAQGFRGCGSEDTSLTSGTCDYDLTTGCSSSNLVGVACTSSSLPEGTIRLFGGNNITEGRVEILFNGRWGRICVRSWDNVDGAVACEELGFGADNVSAFGTDNFPGLRNTVQPIWLNDLDCASTSASLEECPHLEPIGYADCYDSFDSPPFAVLDCAAPECNVQFCEACRDDSNTCAVCQDGFEVDDQAACMRAGGTANKITTYLSLINCKKGAALLGSIVLALSALCYIF